jgi:hypothetical protein
MVDEEQQGVNDISDYVKSKGIFIAKKEKQEWQNILSTARMSPTLKKWVREIIKTRYKGV